MHSPENRRPTLMVVHAHPDDEASQTGGTLARYAAEGFRTVLVTCTDGGQGDGVGGEKPGHPGHRPEEVAARRSDELARSAAALGVSRLIRLGHPDSGLPGSPTTSILGRSADATANPSSVASEPSCAHTSRTSW